MSISMVGFQMPLFFNQVVLNRLHPLGRVGHFEGSGVFFILRIDKIYFNERLMQIYAFVGSIVIDPGNT